MTTAQIQLTKEIKSNADLLASVIPKNPILARMRDEILSAPHKAITSYDRMHNRHNRS
ncbi:MAG: hypothetical protein L3J59_15545 [Methylococcaceae bacterium]|nr:hypothetical protein [Methylococcaceae bacterium]